MNHFHHPDPIKHRHPRRERKRAHTAEKNRLYDAALNQTGIRVLRRRPMLTTPNCFPPGGFVASEDSMDAEAPRESVEPQHCYVCEQKYSLIHHFYDHLCRPAPS